MLRGLSILSVRPAALLASVALHAAAVVAGGHAVSSLTGDVAAPVSPSPISVEVETLVPAPVEPERDRTTPVRATEGSRAATHHHSYPVPPDHDEHPHDPSLVHAPFAATPPAAAPPAGAPPEAAPPAATHSADAPVFVLRAPVVFAAVQSPEAKTGVPAGAATAPSEPSGSDPTFAEGEVDAPAARLTTPKIEYPAAAAAAGIEADVPVEIVVDPQGAVVSARALAKSGYGLDEEAVRAARASRFSPARRAGRAVRVRMRWNILFRLP